MTPNPPLLPPRKLAAVYLDTDVRARPIADALWLMKWIADKTNLPPADVKAMADRRYKVVAGWYLPIEKPDGR